MSKLEHEIPPPEGWPTAWVNRELPSLACYVLAITSILALCICLTGVRGVLQMRHLKKELAANPSDRAAISKRIHERRLKTDRAHFKFALAYLANTLVITMVDGFIAIFVLVKDASDNPDVWDRQMLLEVGLYCVYLLVLFVASFVLIPLLQMLAVTWALTRFSRKNTLSDYVPEARAYSTLLALMWSAMSFCVVTGWPLPGSGDETATRFILLEASWGSALAWLEASFLFIYLSHAIGDKELNRGNGVGELVSLFAKAATGSFRKSKSDTLPQYEEVAQDEPAENEKLLS